MPGYFNDGCTGYTYAYGTIIHGNYGAVQPNWAVPGGTGSIYPGEFGQVPNGEYGGYDQWSGNRGYTQSVYYRGYQIADVSLNDTFETWRNKTNTEIIEKLNLLRVYGITHGDGIMLSSSTGGTAAIAFSGNITRTNVTFCNFVSVGKGLKVNGVDVLAPGPGEDGGAPAGSLSTGYNFTENLLILDNQDDKVGCNFSGIIVGGGVTGPTQARELNNLTSPESIGSDRDPFNAFVYDRPYFVHKDAKWRTKESIWLEGYLDHSKVYSGRSADGSTGEEYPHGPYGYTGCGITYDDAQKVKGPSGGVVRIFFGPTLTTSNYIDIDGRGGSAGATGMPWCDPLQKGERYREVGGATGSLVISNDVGPLLEFDTSYHAVDEEDFGFVNIHRGANRKRIVKGSHGFKVGNVLRYSGTTQGYTFASAAGMYEAHGDGNNAAEVIGMVSKVVDANTFDITYVGEVVASPADWNSALVENHTKGLVEGCVYYLSQFNGADRGKIQHAKPDTVGYIMKPVMVATGRSGGVVFPYVGTYLSPTGCSGGGGSLGGGASGDDATLFEVAFNKDQQTLNAGDVVCVNTQFSGQIGRADAYKVQQDQAFGVVYESNNTTGICTIATSGTITWPTFRLPKTGTYFLNTSGGMTQAPGANRIKIGDAISPATFIINIQSGSYSAGGETRTGGSRGTYRRRGSGESSVPGEYKSILSATGATGYTFDNKTQVNENLLMNGNFGIWQRGIGVTGDYTGISQTYFADRWVRISQTGTGGDLGNNPYHSNPSWNSAGKAGGISGGTHRTLSYKLSRGEFDKKQMDVEGHPDYYAIIKGAITYHGGTTNNEFYKVEQRMPDCTSFAGNIMTASFYARSASGTGDLLLGWTQNLTGTTGPVAGATHGGNFKSSSPIGVTAGEVFTPITRFRIGTGWDRYAYSFFVPEVSSLAGASGNIHTLTRGTTADHFAALSFYSQLTGYPTINKDSEDFNVSFNNDFHLAQVKLEHGSTSTAFNYVNPNEELRKCQRFYQTSYEYNVPVGSSTMFNSRKPDTSGVSFLVPGLFIHLYEFPERMRKTPTCALYSPTGRANEGYNRDAKKDMRFVAGSKGTLGEVRSTNPNGINISCYTDTANCLEIRVLRGAAKLDTIQVHYSADAEFNNALPSKPTTT